MWTYERATGQLRNNGALIGTGYSGRGDGLNNPQLSNVPDVGPIPAGTWTIGPFVDDPEKGPIVTHLVPCMGTETFGRSGFMIHGDNPEMNHSASEGCIILGRDFRIAIRDSGDTALEVQ